MILLQGKCAHRRHAATSNYATFRGAAASLIGGGKGLKVVVKRTWWRCFEADSGE